MDTSFLKDIKQLPFPEHQYKRINTNKTQICLHHSVSGNSDRSIEAIVRFWKSDSLRVATPILIAKSGLIGQVFSTRFYGGHIGFDSKRKAYKEFKLPKKYLSKISIGVELLNWGGLKKIEGSFFAAYGNKVDCEVQYYPDGYRGYHYFEKYSDEQIESLRKLILYWNEVYNIPLDYNKDIWDVTPRALNSEPGIYSHTSYRYEKSDCHPQPELIKMLKNLKNDRIEIDKLENTQIDE